jgi:signal transduction histidine kinase/DNA-binding response OmpR family regulator
MSFDTILSVALDLAFFGLFAFTFVDYLRHRDPVRRAVVLVFGSLAIVLGVPLLRSVAPWFGPLTTPVALAALLAHPVLVLWLVSHVRPVPRGALALAGVAFVGLTGAALAVMATGTSSAGTALAPALAVGLLVYFAVLEGAGAVGFALASRSRAGASRSRLVIAAIATGLFAVALVILLAGGLATTPGSDASTATNAIVRVVALLSALGYLAAFAPPGFLRRLSQQSIVYNFIRDLSALPSGTPVEQIWQLLERAAAGASGAMRAEITMEQVALAPRVGVQRRTFPLGSERWPDAGLELDLPRNALFLEDDVELTGLLVDRATRAAERESFLIEREQLIGELQAASAAKSDFLASMSHELRTPLNAIIGFSELLTEGGEEAADAATVATYSGHIHASGLHLLELVNDVLDLARVEAGRLDLKPVHFELNDLVLQTIATLQPLADQKNQVVTLDLDPVGIEADPSRVRQIILNLLSNAIKFTDAGGEIRLSVSVDAGGEARLTVADTGHGIGVADIDRIFEAFHQAESEGRPRQEGTGLGLALTRQLVEAHGGRIEVRSEIGVGSAFTVRLPIRHAVVDPSLEHPPAIPPGKPSVLVIEDDSAARELLRLHLEGAGYAVLATSSGRQGLAWVTEARPDAVLLDILLPDIDGWEILQRLKADPQTRAIPVMVVSVVDNRQLGLALGAIDYFVKPISREPLLEAIGRLTFTTKVRSRTVTALVIDADPEAVRRYRELLEPDGFRVIAAVDGATGHKRAIDDRPDLILLDSTLPDVDGFELAATLRHDPATSTIPIWLTTPAGLPPETKARLNGNVQVVLERGEEALAAMHGWLETGRPVAPALPPNGMAGTPASLGTAPAAPTANAAVP